MFKNYWNTKERNMQIALLSKGIELRFPPEMTNEGKYDFIFNKLPIPHSLVLDISNIIFFTSSSKITLSRFHSPATISITDMHYALQKPFLDS